MFMKIFRAALFALLFASSPVLAEPPYTLDDNIRYLSMGDSYAAGKGAIPVTQGFAYLLYQEGVFGPITNMTFANAAVPGVTSGQVLSWQVPAAVNAFKPDVITLSVGGNDLETILTEGADPVAVLTQFASNLQGILCGLRAGLPDVTIIVGNFPDLPELSAVIPSVRQGILALNQIIANVAPACDAKVADVFSAFEGRTGLLLAERNGVSLSEPHPTNAGYRVMAKAYEDAANQ